MWLLRTWPLVDEPQALRLVPTRHDDQLGAVGQVDGREAERGGVVQRAGDEVRALAVEAEHHARPPPPMASVAPRLGWRARFTPLGRPVVPDV